MGGVLAKIKTEFLYDTFNSAYVNDTEKVLSWFPKDKLSGWANRRKTAKLWILLSIYSLTSIIFTYSTVTHDRSIMTMNIVVSIIGSRSQPYIDDVSVISCISKMCITWVRVSDWLECICCQSCQIFTELWVVSRWSVVFCTSGIICHKLDIKHTVPLYISRFPTIKGIGHQIHIFFRANKLNQYFL